MPSSRAACCGCPHPVQRLEYVLLLHSRRVSPAGRPGLAVSPARLPAGSPSGRHHIDRIMVTQYDGLLDAVLQRRTCPPLRPSNLSSSARAVSRGTRLWCAAENFRRK